MSMAVCTRVRLLHSVERDARLVRCAVGSVFGWVYLQGGDAIMPGAGMEDAVTAPQQPQIPVVLVQFDEGDYIGESCVDGVDRVVPITADKFNLWMDGRSYQCEMLPLEPCKASTVHSAQGTTVEHHVMIPPGGSYDNCALAPSRFAEPLQVLMGLILLIHRVTAMFTKFFAQIAPINEEYDRLRALPKWRVWLAEAVAAQEYLTHLLITKL